MDGIEPTMRYVQVVESFLRHLGPLREKGLLTAVSSADVQSFSDSEAAAGKSSATVMIAVKILNIPFNQALRAGLIPKNPVTGIVIAPSQPQTRKVFTWTQVE